MNVNNLPFSVRIGAPANFSGTYNCADSGGNWCWYHATRSKEPYFPHLSVSASPHESAKDGHWAGFHVSVPLKSSNLNAHIQFRIVNFLPKYDHLRLKDLPDQAREEAFECIVKGGTAKDEGRESTRAPIRMIFLEYARQMHAAMAPLDHSSGVTRATPSLAGLFRT